MGMPCVCRRWAGNGSAAHFFLPPFFFPVFFFLIINRIA